MRPMRASGRQRMRTSHVAKVSACAGERQSEFQVRAGFSSSFARSGIWIALLLFIAGCHQNNASTKLPALPQTNPHAIGSQGPLPRFEDVTARAGINWLHNPCRTGKKLLPETVGGGGGFLDYNNDGNQDVILINGSSLPGYAGTSGKLALYRNNGNGTFTDVTRESGLDFKGYGFSVAVGDYDNDGWEDLYVTSLDGNRLYHNDHGHFRDVTSRSGLGLKGFCTCAAWIDYNRDGKLDLFVGSYVDWTAETDLPCGPKNARQYCAPNQYKGAQPHLFKNCGDSTFQDVTQAAGLHNLPGKTLGVAVADFNNDGWPDLFVADDTVANVMLINNRDGTFTDQALLAGVALADEGLATGSMGVDIGTPYNDGRTCIAIGTFAAQETSLFVSGDQDPQSHSVPLFENKKREYGLADLTQPMTTFGIAFADVDLDGNPDLILVNGHIDDDPDMKVKSGHVPYKQPIQLFLNSGSGSFKEVGQQAGLTGDIVGRGLAIGDFDNDGRPDLLVFENGGKVRLWHNRTEPHGNWIGVRLVGTKSPRDGTGAIVQILGPGINQSKCIGAARSYLASCDLRALFGVGQKHVDRLIVKWPDGAETRIDKPIMNHYLTVTEPRSSR